MTIGCNIWIICLKLIFHGLSRMLQFSQFIWRPCYSVWDVFNNFLLIDSTDRIKISSFFIALSLYPLLFFANTPFKLSSPRASLKLSLDFTVNRNISYKVFCLNPFLNICICTYINTEIPKNWFNFQFLKIQILCLIQCLIILNCI